MAARAPSLRACGCILASGVRCQHSRARDRERPTARQRGYDTEYQRAAREFLSFHPRCTCGAPAVLVRHIVSIARRPDVRMDRSNWLPGCRSCNAADWHNDRRTGGVSQTLADRGRDRLGPRLGTHRNFSFRDREQNR